MFSNAISKNDLWQVGKRALLAAALLLTLIVIGLIVSAVSAQRAEKNFEQAADFPRGALVYAQFQDLPALLKQWNESELKGRYDASVNFQQMQSRHLAMKLLARWKEFNSAAGFEIDFAALGSVADNRAAIAIYDIGKLDLMLIAPMSEAGFQACRFARQKDDFQEIELPNGVTYYLRDVEADRGRQKQHIAFAQVKGRFVFATNESLLLRAVANITGAGKPAQDRLNNEPSFQALAKTVQPHFVTVWVEQAKLNDDWYFKHYWLMSEIADLKNIRAGMFDLEMQQGQWIERREFLTNGNPNSAAVSPLIVGRLQQLIPADAPFAQLRSVDGDSTAVADLVSGALFAGKPRRSTEARSNRDWENYSGDYFEVSSEEEDLGEGRYSYLGYEFDSEINEASDNAELNDAELRLAGERRFVRGLQSALQAGRPLAAAKLARPRASERVLFAEFARASVISLQNASAVNRAALERAIDELAASRLMIAGASGKFIWKNRIVGAVECREMELPMLGRSVVYGLRGKELIVANNLELLVELMTGQQTGQHRAASTSPVHELTVIRFSQRKSAFDQIFTRLEEPMVKAYWQQRIGEDAVGPSQEFFSGEVASLLDVAAPVDEVRIQRSFANGRMKEEIIAKMK
ncbi:MAG: hypothetical protein ACKVZH_00140 [Blastocatellia bacterium]